MGFARPRQTLPVATPLLVSGFFHQPSEVARALVGDGTPLLLCLDYDGTLRENDVHWHRPESPPELLALLSALVAHPLIEPVIVTGRALAEAKALVPVRGLGFAGEHGMEVDAAGLRLSFTPEPEVTAAVRTVFARWRELEAATPGTMVQEKGRSGSFHLKGVPEEFAAFIESEARRLGEEFARDELIEFTGGWRIVELRPRGGWTKGTATVELTRHLRTRVAFIGDDLTDEDALRILPDLAPSIGIRVCREEGTPTAATWRLRSVGEVLEVLSALLDNLGCGSDPI